MERDELLKQAKVILQLRCDERRPPFDYYPCVKYYKTLVRRAGKLPDGALQFIVDAFEKEDWAAMLEVIETLKDEASHIWENRVPTVVWPSDYQSRIRR